MSFPFIPADASIVAYIAAHRPLSLTYTMIGVSEFGGTPVIAGTAAVAILILAVYRRDSLALGLATSLAFLAVTRTAISVAIARLRPPVVMQAYHETGYSFPSGHAAWSLALYGFFLWVLWHLPLPRRQKKSITVGLVGLIVAVGASRVILGVHYPTDVLGGWLLGLIAIACGIAATRILAHRAHPSREGPPTRF